MIQTARCNEPRQTDLSAVIDAIRDGVDLHGAACAGPLAWLWDDQIDTEANNGEPKTARAARHAKAQAVCRLHCHVRAQCLEDRIHGTDLRGGVHGGEVFAEGSRLPVTAQVWHRDCDECGSEFDATSPERRFCKDACREASKNRQRAADARVRRRANGTPPAPTECHQCGGWIDELLQRRRKHYCSDDCDRAAERERKRASRAARRAA